MSRWKQLAFGIAAVLLFFGLLEALLWVAGVPTLLAERDPFLGFSRQVRVYELDSQGDVYRTLPRAVRHSFNNQQFAAHKPDGALRIFVIGGSSAYGFPWDERSSFSRFLRDALRATWPDRQIEVINSAAMSYGSHRLRILTHELLTYEPDLLVLYGGHNEYVERRFYNEMLDRDDELDVVRKTLDRWRFYSLLTRVLERSRRTELEDRTNVDSRAKTTGELLGLDVVREKPTRISPDEAEEVRRRFEENLRAIVELARLADVTVVLCTVPSNLSGWAPNASRFSSNVSAADRPQVQSLLDQGRRALERGDPALAASLLESAADLAPGYAEVSYLIGQAYERLGRWDEARAAFSRARDSDAQPARAPAALNDAIRDVAADLKVTLVDVERAFESVAPHGLLGFNLFEDYVHPKPEGHRLIALELWTRVLEDGLIAPPRTAPQEEFWAAIGERGTPPSVSDPTAPASSAEAKTAAQLFNLAIVLGNQGLVEQAAEKYRACLELDPTHHFARSNLARMLILQGRLSEAELELRKVLAVEPQHLEALLGLGETLRRAGLLDEAVEAFERATRADPGSVEAWRALGFTRRERQDYPQAAAAYRQATELDPREPEIRAELGAVLLAMQRIDAAEAAFRACLELDPGSLAGRNGIAAVLFEQGKLDEAEREFNELLRINPRNEYARRSLDAIRQRRAHPPK
jgi:tetratricopeptide (TPR) repeat protein